MSLRALFAVVALVGCTRAPVPTEPPSSAKPVAAAPRDLRFRLYSTGKILGQPTITTFELHLEAGHAHLAVSKSAVLEKGGPPQVGKVLEMKSFDAATPDALHTWSCHDATLDVAVAKAVRVRKDPDLECGDTGAFSPATTEKVQVLLCTDEDEVRYAFAEGPGVEWLYVNDDCVMQGGGFRRIADDLSIAAPRPASGGSASAPPR